VDRQAKPTKRAARPALFLFRRAKKRQVAKSAKQGFVGRITLAHHDGCASEFRAGTHCTSFRDPGLHLVISSPAQLLSLVRRLKCRTQKMRIGALRKYRGAKC
jgi:hypothetical protein